MTAKETVQGVPDREMLESERCRRNRRPLFWLSYALAAGGLLLFLQNRLAPGPTGNGGMTHLYDPLYAYLAGIGLAYRPLYRLTQVRGNPAGCARLQLIFVFLAMLGALSLAVSDILQNLPDLTGYVFALVIGAMVYRGRRTALILGNAAAYAAVAAALLGADGGPHPALLIQGAVYAAAAVFIGLTFEWEFERSVATTENLRRSEARLRTLFARNKAVMLLIDPATGAILEANAAAQRFYGYTRRQFTGMHLEDISLHPPGRVGEARERAAGEARDYSVFLHRLASGERRTVEVYSSPIESQGQTLLFTIIHDITERMGVEDELRKFSAVVEQAPNPIVITDLQADIEHVNPAFTAVTGYTAEEALGRNPKFLKSDQTPPERYRQMWDTLAAGRVWQGEFRNRRKDGSLYWERAVIVPLMDGTGRRVNYLGIKEDITDRKLAEEALRESNRLLAQAGARAGDLAARAEAASRAKSAFLANTSHELRTPLTAILGFSEILAAGLAGPLNERQTRYVRAVHESGEHLLALINDILDLSKVDHGAMRLELTVVDLADLVQRSLSIVRQNARQKALVLETDLPPEKGALILQADERKIKQILYNLLSNAVKFTPQGGRITVGARGEGGRVVLFVRDTGIGIPVEEQEKIFGEFYQVNSRAGGDVPGTGLGLALVRRMVDLHGGTIRVESGGPGTGSCFICTLPVRQPAAAARPGQESAQGAGELPGGA